MPEPPVRTEPIAGNVLILVGVPLVILGGILWVATGNAVSECSSILVRALNQRSCSEYTTIHNLGTLLLVGGAIALVLGVAKKINENKES